MSDAIAIVPYDERWPAEFRRLGAVLRGTLGPLAERIDHIGSTAVPGLAAKDVIDVQVTVARFDPEPAPALEAAGLVALSHITADHQPPGVSVAPDQLEKRLFQSAPNDRRSNVHVRIEGRFNQRYALLCRDYLRTHPLAAAAYGRVKVELARLFPYDAEAYYDVKDPVFDILMAGAEDWAVATGWRPGESDA